MTATHLVRVFESSKRILNGIPDRFQGNRGGLLKARVKDGFYELGRWSEEVFMLNVDIPITEIIYDLGRGHCWKDSARHSALI
jgi:hypothetical protein